PTKGRTMSGTRSVGSTSSVVTVNDPAGSPSTCEVASFAPSVSRRIAAYSGSAYIAAAERAGRGRCRVSRSFIGVLPSGDVRVSLEQAGRAIRAHTRADAYPGPMPSLSKFLADNRALTEKEADWLQHLVGDWNLLSDLLRADLVLWIQEEQGPLAVAHCRPATGSTVYYEDPVGSPSDDGEESAEITRLL